jgi:multidrug efflux pump subunit AcrA (membrane-fusion protein)
LLLLALAFAAARADQVPPLLTGQVFSRQAQDVIVPLTTDWQARISVMAPEGSFVEEGQVVVEFDGTEAARQLEAQSEAARTEQARTDRDLARLEKELVQAEFRLEHARVGLELAIMKADIPEGLIGSLEYADNQLAMEAAEKEIEDARNNLADKRQSLAERREQAELDLGKIEMQERWWAEMAESFVVRANQPGYIIYRNHPWTRAKFQEGDNVQTSFRIEQIADTSDLAIKVWINSIDKPRIRLDAPVRIVLDALPAIELSGRLESISDSGSKRTEWGNGIYFEGVVSLDDTSGLELLPGMSALVEVGS